MGHEFGTGTESDREKRESGPLSIERFGSSFDLPGGRNGEVLWKIAPWALSSPGKRNQEDMKVSRVRGSDRDEKMVKKDASFPRLTIA